MLRECTSCKGTDDALMTRQADNEKTLLLSRWFHCVRLPEDVVAADHPFHALFAGDAPPHLFLAAHDGTGRLDLDGQQSRAQLWEAMDTLLAASYADRYAPALKELSSLLDRLDAVDQRIEELQRALDREAESRGGGGKLEKLGAKLEGLRADRDALRARAREVSILRLRPEEPESSR